MALRPLLRLAVLAWVVFLAGAARAQAPQGAGLAAFAERAFAERQADDYVAAVEAYLDVLRAEPDGRFARQLALILPDSVAAAAQAGDGDAPVLWWRRHDPIPSTPLHEGVVEHRLRVAEAETHFAAPTPTGFDARGEVFVRFGTPERRRRIDFESDLFISRAIREDPSIRRSDFPPNEAWHYPALGPDVYFLFVRGREGYHEGTTMDLLPRALLAGGVGDAMEGRVRLLGQAMRWVYKDLYVFSSDVRSRLVEIDAVVGGDGRGFAGNTGLQLAGEVQRARQEDDKARVRRDAALPPSRSRILDGRGGGTEWRVARFLDGGGRATVLIPWKQPTGTWDLLATGGSSSSLGTALIDVTVVRYDQEYQRDSVETDMVVASINGEPSGPRLLTVRDVSVDSGIAVEWAQRRGTAEGRPLSAEPVLATVARVGPAGELLDPSAKVGLSDLLLFSMDAVEAAGGWLNREEGLPTPLAGPTVHPGQRLAGYFEVYPAGDERLPIQTEVYVGQRTGGRFLRRAREVGSSVATDQVLDGRRLSRTVDLGAVPQDADEVYIEVVVTTEETGERVSRSIMLPVKR